MTDNDGQVDENGRRDFLGGTLIGLAGGSLVALSSELAQAAPGEKSKAKLIDTHICGSRKDTAQPQLQKKVTSC